MATDAVRHRGRRKAAGRAARDRREKIALGVGVLLLAVILALEGPKTLDKLSGSTPASAPAVTTPQGSKAASAATPHPVSLEALSHYSAKDVFAPQLSSGSESSTAPTPSEPPAVRKSHFVAKDPFVQQVTVAETAPAAPAARPAATAPATTTPVTTTPATPAVAASGNLIVIVASIAVQRGQKAADAAAARARARGVPNVHVVLSSDYPTLRLGYYAVYSGPYPTLAKALSTLQAIRGRGYVSAYTRRLAK